MSDDFRRTEISDPGAPIREIRIDLPQHLRDAISESLDRGKRAAQDEARSDRKPLKRSATR